MLVAIYERLEVYLPVFEMLDLIKKHKKLFCLPYPGSLHSEVVAPDQC